MSDVDQWSEVAAQNVDATPDGAPEGHARSAVNDITREAMSGVRRQFEDPGWFDKTKGPTGQGFTLTKGSGTDKVNLVHESTPTDASAKFPVGSRVRVGDGATLVEGFVTAAAFASPTTTITINLDGAAVIQATPTTFESNITDNGVGNVAFSTIGVTLAQDPVQIPSIDLLGDGVQLDQGEGNGFDADTVDGQHASDLITAAASSRLVGLINGDFAIGQRGHALTATTSFPTDNAAYVADGWALLSGDGTSHPAGGSGVVDINLINSGASGKAAGRAIQIEANANLSASPHEKVALIEWLPGDVCEHLEGTKVSLSIWANRPVGTDFDQVRMAVVFWAGTRDAITSVDPIDDWGAVGVTPTLLANYTMVESPSFLPSSDWSEHKLENVAIPVGTNNIAIMIWTDDTSFSSGMQIEFTGVSFVTGETAQTWVHEDYATNLGRCQRFFNSTFEEGGLVREKGGDEATALRIITNTGSRDLMLWELGTSMFATPTITTYNPAVAGTSGSAPWDLDGTVDATITATNANERRVEWLLTSAGNNKQLVMHATADASIS